MTEGTGQVNGMGRVQHAERAFVQLGGVEVWARVRASGDGGATKGPPYPKRQEKARGRPKQNAKTFTGLDPIQNYKT